MQKAAQNLSQRKQAWFRAALLVLFVCESVAFDQRVGVVAWKGLAWFVGAAVVLLLPLAFAAFRRFRHILVFSGVVLLTFALLYTCPLLAAKHANAQLGRQSARIIPGMTRRQVEFLLNGYEQQNNFGCCLFCDPTTIRNSSFYAVTSRPFSHSGCVEIYYKNDRVSEVNFTEYYGN